MPPSERIDWDGVIWLGAVGAGSVEEWDVVEEMEEEEEGGGTQRRIILSTRADTQYLSICIAVGFGMNVGSELWFDVFCAI